MPKSRNVIPALYRHQSPDFRLLYSLLYLTMFWTPRRRRQESPVASNRAGRKSPAAERSASNRADLFFALPQLASCRGWLRVGWSIELSASLAHPLDSQRSPNGAGDGSRV